MFGSMQIHTHQSVDRFGLSGSMIFAHTDQPLPMAIYDPVCIAHFFFRGDRPRLPSWSLAINALICEIGEVDRAFMDCESTAAVLMYTSPGIERRWSDVFCLPIRRMLYNNAPAAFCWSHLDPVDILPIESNL